MKKKKLRKTYEYSCTLTGKTFVTTREAPHPGELVSIRAYYELHPDQDDRPEVIKRQLKLEEEAELLAETKKQSMEMDLGSEFE